MVPVYISFIKVLGFYIDLQDFLFLGFGIKILIPEMLWTPVCSRPCSLLLVPFCRIQNSLVIHFATSAPLLLWREYPEFDPEVDGGPLGRCECLELGLLVTPPPTPYSDVELTDLAVSAGRYGTGTVFIPPFREYLKSRLEDPVWLDGEVGLELPSGWWDKFPSADLEPYWDPCQERAYGSKSSR